MTAAPPLALTLGILWGALLPAQVPELPPKPPEQVLAIVGGTVLPAVGPAIPRGTVIVRGAKIDALGAELPAPAGAQVVSADGKYVTPGLIAVEASGVGVGSTDGNIADSLDPYALSLRIALSSGITTVNLVDMPFFGFFGSEAGSLSGANSAIIKLTHGDLASMLVREPGLNYLSMPGRQIELNLFRLREGFRKAEEHLKAVKDAEARKAEAPRVPREIAHIVTILERKRPTVVAASTDEDVRQILAIEARYPFDLVIAQPTEAYGMAREIAKRRIPVLFKARGADFDFDLGRPILDESGLIPIRVPAAFSDLGADVTILPYRRGISTDGLAGRDLGALHLEAAFAVRGGLDEVRAIAAITIEPARVLRIADRVGSLEKGKDADILVWSGHPLDYRAVVERAYLNGKLYYDRSTSPLYRPVPLR
ncbi:MAG TPA: amidohydrolase family protein [Planctomycetota bacterium]|nr:amidohydrolase family protein [Planctomycetota bacterium]